MRELNILYLTDNNYAPFAGISITSMFINNKSIDKFRVFIIDDGISIENKKKFEDTAKQYGHEIIFLDMTEGINTLKKAGAPKYRNSYTTYLKLFAFGLLPEDVHRIFFIDSDSVVVGDLGEMVDINMEGHIIGAVRDGISHPYKVAMGYDPNDSWFNMGVMLVDIDKWKREDAEAKILAQLKKRNAYMAVDQDLLNITQHGDIMTLHPRYNATPHHYVYDEKEFRKALPQGGFYESLEIMEESQKNPVIRHFERFIGESAWSLNTIHPYADLFDEYMMKSLWKDYEKKPAKGSMVLKVEGILYRILPKNLFLRIWALYFKYYLININRKMEKSSDIKNIS